MAKEKVVLDDNLHWYKDAIIYELHIKAFKDSNGDGIGDFKGLIEKLDYLEDLGVNTIWLLPFYPSPQRDDGYDIMDYYKINPSYGNLNDFKKFMKKAHKRGLRVITELVINHTSDQHPWFQRARRAKPGTSERDFYVWSDNPDKYNEVRIIFQDFETSNWSWDPVANAYYWHRFFSHQPDLNYDNLAVQEEIFKVLDFWMDMGVDGFRLDAVPYLFERDGTNCENLPETHAFLKKLRKHIDDKRPGTLMLAEANMWPEDSASYFGNGDECHMNYHFPIMPRMFMSLKMEDRYPIIDIMDQTPEIPKACQWAMFLRNHDELTLEMVTDEERDYMYKVYTKDPLAKINMGIRHRLGPLLDNNRKKIEIMNYLLFSLPGTPIIYYGDEIGMGDNYYLGDRDGVRTPMQWSPDRNAGFSDANPQKLYLPAILDPEYHFESVNVETQQRNPSSLLWWMKRVMSMRKKYKAFSRGDIEFLPLENSKVLVFLRTYEDETILVIANLSRFSQAAELDLREYKDYVPMEVFSQNKFPIIKENPYLFMMGPNGYYWFLLTKEKVGGEAADGEKSPTVINVNRWENLLTGKGLQTFENSVLPKYLDKCRWFGGKAKTIRKIRVMEGIDIPSKADFFALLLIEVSYNEGLPEVYQLPIAFTPEEKEEEIKNNPPQSYIASISVAGQRGVLYDAVFNSNFRKILFTMMAKKKKLRSAGSELSFYATKETSKLLSNKKDELASRVLGVEQSNSSITYEQSFFLKLYRKLDRTLNPDMEITKFLSEKTKFKHVPKFVGAIEHKISESSPPMVLGMMQEMVPNQGDAWAYINDSLNRYFERVLTTEYGKPIPKILGDFSNPVGHEDVPDDFQNLLSAASVERVRLLGIRTGELHMALASGVDDKDFRPEGFSLHYQRSLFSSLQSLVRGTYQSLNKNMKKLPDDIQEEAQEILDMRKDVLDCLKNIYARKITTLKIRNHGDYHLGQVLFTGKDFVILDFEGEPARSFSERRLKRSPLRDVAGMIRSFHYAAYNVLFQNDSIRDEDAEELEKWAEQWYHYMSGFFLKAYLETTKGSDFIPKDQEDLNTLLQTFLLEKAVYEVNYELNNRPDWVIIPMRGIKYIMRRYLNEDNKKTTK